ncbi:MAG TPA: Gfo/Idh/MocA family oxidoreductase [Urbifossiella sp.]|jgi:hypothetical protein|nr:Gfo/Idh/MocA family oxidoreductase [Urbifossiella sp.]
MPDPLSLRYLPTLPRRLDWRIGCVGAGFIMRDCHLVAYRTAGFNPVAIASRTAETAREVAAARGVPTAHASINDLLRDETVEILDVAVPPAAQPDLIRRAVELGAGGSAASWPRSRSPSPPATSWAAARPPGLCWR